MKNIMFTHFVTFLGPLLFLGSIDQIITVDETRETWASVELSNSKGETRLTWMDTGIFPCQVVEGDVFYITILDGVTELRCGEPPE